MAIVFGTISRKDVKEFIKLCDSRGWLVTHESNTEIRYLDRNMNGHTIRIDSTAKSSSLFVT